MSARVRGRMATLHALQSHDAPIGRRERPGEHTLPGA